MVKAVLHPKSILIDVGGDGHIVSTWGIQKLEIGQLEILSVELVQAIYWKLAINASELCSLGGHYLGDTILLVIEGLDDADIPKPE